MTNNIDLETINKRIALERPEAAVGNLIYSLLDSDIAVSASLRRLQDRFQLKIDATETGELKSSDFYEIDDHSVETVSSSPLVGLLSFCSTNTRENIFNAVVKFHDEDKYARVDDNPLETTIREKKPSDDSGVQYFINLSDSIVRCCDPIRRRSQLSDNLDYELIDNPHS